MSGIWARKARHRVATTEGTGLSRPEMRLGSGSIAVRAMVPNIMGLAFAAFVAMGPGIAASNDPTSAPSLAGGRLTLDVIQPPQSFSDGFLDLNATLGGSSAEFAAMPSGIVVPTLTNSLEVGDGFDEITYLTPRRQGLQFGWSEEVETSASKLSSRRSAAFKEGHKKPPKSIGANFSEQDKGFEFAFGGDYGRTPRPVPSEVRLVRDRKLLRMGSHIGAGGFRLGGTFGSNVDPRDLGETLSWNIVSRYDRGPLSIGMVYSYTIDTESEDEEQEDILGTFQTGVGYAFSPNLRASLNAVYWDKVDQDGKELSHVAGIFGLSFRF